jgi:hypothetical protein
MQALFAELAAQMEAPLFVPTEVPEGATLTGVRRGVDEPAGETGGATGASGFVLSTSSGWMEVLADVQGDLGDLPSREVVVAGEVPAEVTKLLGGTMVQWRWEGFLYAVYGKGFTEKDVLRFSEGLVVLAAE